VTTDRKVGKEVVKMQMYKPGEKAPVSSQAEIIGPRGGETGEERTVVRGEPFPPTPKPNQGYIIVDRTRHRGR